MKQNIYNIVGIISSHGSVLSHVNLSGRPIQNHSMVFPSKFTGRWRWLSEHPEMILYMGSDDWDSEEKMLVYEHLRALLISYGHDTKELDHYVTNYQL